MKIVDGFLIFLVILLFGIIGAVVIQWLIIEPDKTLVEILKHTFLSRWYGR